MNEPSSATDLLRKIANSAGSDYLNRIHQRSFSLNVFRINAVELMEAAQRVKDPDQGMALMMQKNREAGRQAHRELNRHVHNFASSAMTLVEHTRIFMRKHYKGTDLLATYETQAETTFSQSPIAQFIQGLRNYMLHKGLPDSSMFMSFTPNPGAKDRSGTLETGVHYDTASLLDWDNWKPVARTYLEQVGEHLDLHKSAQEYVTLVDQFHGWLDATLADHHQSDLQELGRLQAQLDAASPSTELISVIPVESPESTTIEPFEFKLTQATELDQISSHLLNEIRELHFQQAPRGFPTQRPTTTITDRELIGPITFWGNEVSGEAAFMFIQHEGKSYGLSETSYESLEGLIDAAMKSTWARNSLSREFVKNTFCDWARQRFGVDGLSFPEALSTAAKKSVTAIEVWAPIANMEIEQNFDFGPVRIESVTNSVMESLRSRTSSTRPEQRQQVDQLFDELENEILGYAAVVISMKTEPAIAQERALKIAQDTVGLLRFFSLPASQSHLFSSVALTGAEYIPTSKLIVLRESGFLLQHSALPKHVAHWRLPKQELAELTSGLLNIAASLVLPDGLSEFALVVRNSLLTYSKGTTLVDPLDRLRNSLSALEGILLKHEIEPRAHNIANRMSFLLAPGLADREAIKQIVHQIYWLQGQSPLVDYGRRENELIMIFTTYACNLLRLALGNISTFSSKTQFLIEVDRMSQFNR